MLSLIGATWIMMQQPNAASRARVRASRRDVEVADRLGVSRPLITTVDLRVVRSRPACDPKPGTGRPLEEAQLVDPHWRRQHHPSDGSHRPIWILPYVRGPEGSPLRRRQKVMVWRR